MSIVGPRPIVQKQLQNYTERQRLKILQMQPGLTGIASLVFRDEEALLERAEIDGIDREIFHDNTIANYKGELEVWWSEHRTIGNYFKGTSKNYHF